MGTWIGVAMGTLVSGGLAAPEPGLPGQFSAWYASAVAGRLDLPPSVVSTSRTFRYVFVGGFRNERMPGYFARNVGELKDIGVPADQIHVVLPSSDRTSLENAEEVRDRFFEVAAKGPERIVVIAHSRGACDVLAFALDHPRFVRDRVRALYLIQGPFGGTGLAGYLDGTGVPMDRRMKWNHRLIGGLVARITRAFAKADRREVVAEMTPEASATSWARALDRDEETLSEVGSKTFFIRSALPPSRQRFLRRALAWYLQTYHGAGDGVVALEDQSLPGFGTVLANLEAGHTDLTSNRTTSRARRGDRRALVRSLVMALGRGEDPSGREPTALKIGRSRSGGGRLDLGEDAVPERKSGVQGRRRREPRVPPADRVVPADF